MEGGGGGGGGGGGSWSSSICGGSSITVGTGALTAAQQLVRGVEQLLDAEMADLRRRTAAASSRIRLLGRTEDPPHSAPSPAAPTPAPTPSILEKDGPGHSHARLKPPRAVRPGPGEGGRARSEPPLAAEEGLYRARSCPGLPRSAGAQEEAGPLPDVQLVRLRGPRGEAPRAPPLNRYSCGALDGPPPPAAAAASATFESCPDFGSLRQCVRRGDSHHSSSSSISSTHSFTRLLQVS
ncbi:hypothetical protein O3P69_018882 [Scylla paramamosain]|uniref:Uncharacterized protein n=1 Tax=Scylla paramamosain TaxID=85552 RepID=A0AAW0STT8_SCYPA